MSEQRANLYTHMLTNVLRSAVDAELGLPAKGGRDRKSGERWAAWYYPSGSIRAVFRAKPDEQRGIVMLAEDSRHASDSR